ncbi:MAG: 50S ribosomal protein L11 methyltransferase [Pseudomonadota bacterium]
MSLPSGYSIADYGDMVDCEPRMPVYAEALKRAVTPGCTVIDIGAGFGIFSLLACKYGAGSVIAIEPDSSIELLPELAKSNGFEDRITVVRGISTQFEPQHKADVIVSDIRGTVPLYESHIATIVDARNRLLADGGKLLPMRDTLRIALVRSPKSYRSAKHPWDTNDYGLDLSAGKRFAVNDSSKVYLNPGALLSETDDLATLDYRSIVNPGIDNTVELVANRSSATHGLLVWFDAEISEGLSYSNAPGEPRLVYGQMFLPFEEPISLKEGDAVSARVRANLFDHDYTWSWDCEVRDGKSAETRQAFRQSTFLRKVIPPAELKPGSNQHVPEETIAVQIDRDCLDLIGKGRSLGDIAQEVLDRHTAHFPDFQHALDHVANLMRRY